MRSFQSSLSVLEQSLELLEAGATADRKQESPHVTTLACVTEACGANFLSSIASQKVQALQALHSPLTVPWFNKIHGSDHECTWVHACTHVNFEVLN